MGDKDRCKAKNEIEARKSIKTAVQLTIKPAEQPPSSSMSNLFKPVSIPVRR